VQDISASCCTIHLHLPLRPVYAICILLSNTIGQEIVSVFHQVRFPQKALAHIWIIGSRRSDDVATTVLSYLNAIALIARHCRNIMITAGRLVDTGVPEDEFI
jgi:hypothetical protein